MADPQGSLIEGRQTPGASGFHAMNPATNLPLEPAFGEAAAEDIARACAAAAAAFDTYRETSLAERASFLETIAANIETIGPALIETASAETGLPPARIETERARTLFQLRLFARLVRDGAWLDARIDPALPDRKPLPRTDLRLRMIGVGPVAVFGSSNFPLAFSVAGGDTASALAAGCPVVVKAHPAHPATSLLVGKAIVAALARCELPAGVFSLLFGAGTELGGALVADPRIKSVGFTGSRGGGVALLKIAAGRAEPIPVHAEMSSINPVLLLPHALAARGQEIAKGFVASLTLGAGQFCTNPGLLIGQAGPALDEFIAAVRVELASAPAATMLTAGIFKAYEKGVAALAEKPSVTTAARGRPARGENQEQPAFFVTGAEAFLADADLSKEVFGAAAVLVSCQDAEALNEVLGALEGQLTISLQMDDGDAEAARALLPALERKAGRLLMNEWPTGVEVCDAMVHGGPFPATSDARATSVGTLAIRRFLRPVCYQNFPAALLPAALREGNPLGIPRLLNGKL